MDAQAVLATARSGNVPSSWFVWPLRRDYVLRSAIGWACAAVFGFVLFIPACLVSLPAFPQRSVLGIVFTSTILLLLGAVAFGSTAIAVADVLRLRRSNDYLLVMTPDDYVKAEPGKITHVPLEHIGDIILRGVKTPDEQREQANMFTRGARFGMGMGLSPIRREPASPPSLSFFDQRTDEKVVVGRDDSYDSLATLEQILSEVVRAKQRRKTG